MDELKIYDIHKDTIEIYKTCFDSNGVFKEAENIEWQFLRNPEKKGYVDIAFDTKKNRTAAIYAVSCIPFKINDHVVSGTQSLDTITDVDYRGKGLFIKLAKDVYQKAADDNVALVYGFPNGNSIHGFKTKLGWEVLDPLPFLIKPLKSSYFTNKIPFLKFLPNINLSFANYSKSKTYSIVEDFSFPESVNELWQSFSKNIKVAVHRDKTYLDWRYINKPFENYKIAHCFDINNKHLGFIIYTVKGKHGGKIAYIMEMIYDLDHPKAAQELLQYAVTQIKKEKADCILSWCLEHSPNASMYKKEFFVAMPEKLRPIELHFGVRSFKTDLNKTVYDRKNWYLSYSDSDTV